MEYFMQTERKLYHRDQINTSSQVHFDIDVFQSNRRIILVEMRLFGFGFKAFVLRGEGVGVSNPVAPRKKMGSRILLEIQYPRGYAHIVWTWPPHSA